MADPRQGAAAELVRRGRLSPEQADAKAPGWRLYVGAAPKLEPQERKQLQEARAGAESAGAVMLDLDRFSALNKVQGSGGFKGLPVIRDVIGAFDPEVGEMNSITNRLAPKERQAGSGAMSDKDLETYKSSVPGQGYYGDANKRIGARRRAGAIREKEYAGFLDYFARVNGSLNGAQEMWDEYKTAEPVYDPQKGQVRRSRGWRDYFGVTPQQRLRPGQSQGQGGASTAKPAAPRGATTVKIGGQSYGVEPLD
jgi:hypothetical protein